MQHGDCKKSLFASFSAIIIIIIIIITYVDTSGAYHVQHVVCHVVQRDSSAIKFARVEITLILGLFYWLNH